MQLLWKRPIEPGDSLLINLETAHQFFSGTKYQEVGNPQHVGVHILVFVIVRKGIGNIEPFLCVCTDIEEREISFSKVIVVFDTDTHPLQGFFFRLERSSIGRIPGKVEVATFMLQLFGGLFLFRQ